MNSDRNGQKMGNFGKIAILGPMIQELKFRIFINPFLQNKILILTIGSILSAF
jgi:hypothetical protein